MSPVALSFRDKLQKQREENGTLLCVGIDPVPARLPDGLAGEEGLEIFVRGIVESTREYACVFKPNLAFFEAFGLAGRRVLSQIPKQAGDDFPVLLDAKLADIGNSSVRYAEAFLIREGFDAITINPYMGYDSVAPFLQQEGKGGFLLCLTSNPGSMDLQQEPMADGRALFLHIADIIAEWEEEFGTAGAVVGATKPEELAAVREILPDLPLLIPGVGAQGGDLEAVLKVAVGPELKPALINASRSIIYASSGADFQEAAAAEASRLSSAMRDLLPALAG